jgi:TetR/AcrR family transcriptional regulator, cholesterol catabolism regulator
MSGIARRRANAAARDSPGYRERVTEIRRAAGRVFHERGFHATTLSDVAEAAQMDRATLYYYVGSKQQLFRDVVSEAVKANIEAAEELAEDPRSSPEKVRALIEQLMNSFEEHFPFMYVMIQEDATKLGMDSAGDDEWLATFREWNARYFSAIATVIDGGLKDGSLSSTLPVRVIANALVGMITSSRAWFTPGGPMSATEVAAGMSQLFLDGLIAPVRH